MTSRTFYPTPSTISYYIYGSLLDDVYRVDFKRSISRQPIYGYNSRQFGFVAEGKELVVGNIIINYRYPGYLRAAIEKAKYHSYENSKMFDQKMNTQKEDKFAYIKLNDIIDNVESVNSLSDKASILGNYILGKKTTTRGSNDLRNTSAAGINDIVSALKENYHRRYSSLSEEERAKFNWSPQSVYSSPLDSRSIQTSTFDLIVKYGGEEGGVSQYSRIFKSCILIGEEETISAAAIGGGDMSSSSQPVLEIYPFFARTIVTDIPRRLNNLTTIL